MSEGDVRDQPDWDSLQRRCLTVGVAALGACALAAFIGRATGVETSGGFLSWLCDPARFFRAYLVAYNYWLGIALGSLAILMVHHLTGGTWGRVIRRVLEAATRTLPLLAILFLPLLLGLADLYPWAHWQAEDAERSELIRQKSQYLNVPFFVGRAAFYFIAWLTVAGVLNRQAKVESADHADRRDRLRGVSAAGLPVYGLTVTFAAIDWAMSIEPFWYSTIYGVIFAANQVLSAFAFAVAVLVLLASYPGLTRLVVPGSLRDLGSLLLAFVMLWTYVSFSQFLLIWSANLPEETPWYLKRLEGGWQVVALLITATSFLLPLLLLLSRDIKQNPRTLLAVAGIIVAIRFVDLFWMVMPAFQPYHGPTLHWMDVGLVVGIGGVWLAVFVRELRRRPLEPLPELELAEAAHHG